jgi:hypothetical protein
MHLCLMSCSCFQEPGFWRERDRERQRRREREIGLAFQLGYVTDCEAKCVLQSRELMVRSLQTTTLILERAFTRHSRQHASSSHTADEGGAAKTRRMKNRTREVDE